VTKFDSISFGTRNVGPGNPVWIIAEVGVNHEGSVDICARMIEAAASSGADAVKLQTIDADANYMRGTQSHALFSRCALTREETARMFDLCRKLGVAPFTTAGDFETLDWVDRLDPVAHKISSGLLTHTPLVRHAAKTGRPLVMSTGMAQFGQIETSVTAAREAGCKGLVVLHCVSLYPAAPESLNLAAIPMLRDRIDAPVGFSDHSIGTDASFAATVLGACMVEKHFSLDTRRPDFDHAISVDPRGMSDLVERIRSAERLLGRSDRPLTREESEKAGVMHRILVARHAIAKGERLSAQSVAFKRPRPGLTGLRPDDFEKVVGRRTRQTIAEDSPILGEMLEDIQ